MPTANGRKGADTERQVAKYLRENGFPQADRRLREGRADDQGDIDGVPLTVIQVKYWAEKRLQKWATETLKQRDTAGVPHCLLVVRTPHRGISGWDAYAPPRQWLGDPARDLGLDERESWTWVRTDLQVAVGLLRWGQGIVLDPPSGSSSATTWTGLILPDGTEVPFSAPSTENESPPSPTT